MPNVFYFDSAVPFSVEGFIRAWPLQNALFLFDSPVGDLVVKINCSCVN